MGLCPSIGGSWGGADGRAWFLVVVAREDSEPDGRGWWGDGGDPEQVYGLVQPSRGASTEIYVCEQRFCEIVEVWFGVRWLIGNLALFLSRLVSVLPSS